MRNQVFKKLFSVLLALIMVAGLLPASVLAEGEGNADSMTKPAIPFFKTVLVACH